MTVLDRLQMGGRAPDANGALNPVMVIAATINVWGNIDVPLVEGGAVVPDAGIEFGICGEGEIVQQRYHMNAEAGGDGAAGGGEQAGGGAAPGPGPASGNHAAPGNGELAAGGSGLPDDRHRKLEAAVHRLSPEPLDMILLASGLTELLERHTPALFRLGRGSEGAGQVQLAYASAAFDLRRIKLLHDAFAVHLLAYEEHLV